MKIRHFYFRHDGHDWEWFLWDVGIAGEVAIHNYLKTHYLKTCWQRTFLVRVSRFFEDLRFI